MNKIISTLFETPNVVNLSERAEYEVQPGVLSPVYINFKAALAVAESRRTIAKEMTEATPLGIDFIAGIESGGSYYAAAVADNRNAGLVLCRKDIKQYNIKNRYAGQLPKEGDSVLLVDDVMSSGNTVAPVVNELTERGCKIDILVGFSYCWEQTIAQNLGVRIVALSNSNDLIEYGQELGLVSEKHAELINDYVRSEESRLVKSPGCIYG